MVKADGYGLGARPVAAALAAAGCRHFFVATGRGLALADVSRTRCWRAGRPVAGSEPDTPNTTSFRAGSLAEIDAWAARTRLDAPCRHSPFRYRHVTAGSRRARMAVLAQDHDRLAGIDVRYVMSHLVSAECAGRSAERDPARAFRRGRAVLPPAPAAWRIHPAFFSAPAFGFDLARPGAALFGVNPTPRLPNPMRPVVRLTARVMAVREIPRAPTVGYNAAWTRLPARAGSRRSASVMRMAGTAACPVAARRILTAPRPLVGRVSMDLTTFDVTDQPARAAGLAGWSCSATCRRTTWPAAGTNGYEVLTSLGRRFHRSIERA